MEETVGYAEFAPELTPDERIQWIGQPNTRIIFHPDDAFMIPFSLMWGGFAIFWTLAASGTLPGFGNKANHSFELFSTIWGTAFVLIGQYMIWGRFIHERWKKRRTYYALTNRRALIVQRSFWGSKSTTSVYFDSLQMIDKRVRADGNGVLAFGGPVTNRWRSGKNNPPPPPSFEDIDEAEAVFRMAEKLRSERHAASPWRS